MIGFQNIMAVGPRGADGKQGEPGKDGTGTGTVNSVNDVEPDATGNIVLPVPPEPDLSGLATKVALKAHEDNKNNIHNVKSEQVNILPLSTKSFSDPPSSYPVGVTTTGVNGISWPQTGSGTILTARGHMDPGHSFQIITSYGPESITRFRRGLGDDTWTPFETLVTSKLPARINALMNAGWTNFPDTHEGLTYYKDSFGVVHVKGIVNRNTAAVKQIMNLPMGYRPIRSFFWIIGQFPPETVKGEITMNSNGDLSFNLGGISASVPIDISFRTD